MPAWRIGFVAAAAGVIDACLRELEWDGIRVSHVAQRAAAARSTAHKDWLDEVADGYRRDRNAAHAAVADHPILSAPLPSATPFLWLDLGGLPAQSLLAAGLAVVDGVHFGMPGRRLPFAGAVEHEAELHRRLALVEAGT